MFKIIGAVFALIVLIFIAIFAFSSWGTIDAGYRGIVLRMGAVTGEIKQPGFYTKSPFVESVVAINVQVQKAEVQTQAASQDLQNVDTSLALNVNINPAAVGRVYQTYGTDPYTVFVDPALKESMKAVIAQYTAQELVTKREMVRDAIAALIRTKLEPAGFDTDAVNITNLGFSPSFETAIEAKVTAEQSALAAQNKLAQVQFEAEQKVAEARGKAESMTIEGASLKANPQTLQLRALEKWDGHLPQYLGSGGIPFIQLPPTAVTATP